MPQTSKSLGAFQRKERKLLTQVTKYDQVEKKVNICKRPYESLADKLDMQGADVPVKEKHDEPDISERTLEMEGAKVKEWAKKLVTSGARIDKKPSRLD